MDNHINIKHRFSIPVPEPISIRRSLHLVRVRNLGKEIDRGIPIWALVCILIEPLGTKRGMHLIRVRYLGQEIDYGIIN